MSRVLIIFIAAWILPQQRLSGQGNCILKKEQDSIRVYSCDDGHQAIKSIRANFQIQASLSGFAATLPDIGNYTAWQYRTVEAKILKRIGDREMIYYIVVSAPWPISNRDLVVHLSIRQDQATGAIAVEANSVPDYIPKVDGLVRVPSSVSHWDVVRQPDNLLLVAYSIQIDPGGSVPAWMVNLVSAQAPYESFRNLKRRMKRTGTASPAAPFVCD